MMMTGMIQYDGYMAVVMYRAISPVTVITQPMALSFLTILYLVGFTVECNTYSTVQLFLAVHSIQLGQILAGKGRYCEWNWGRFGCNNGYSKINSERRIMNYSTVHRYIHHHHYVSMESYYFSLRFYSFSLWYRTVPGLCGFLYSKEGQMKYKTEKIQYTWGTVMQCKCYYHMVYNCI